jgi:4-hydroxybutyrate dehydrogenase
MPAVLQFNKSAIRERFDMAAAYLKIDGGFEGFCAYVDDLNASMSVPKTLTDLGVKDPDIDRLVKDALADPSTGGNPIEMTEKNTRELILDCI